MKEYGAKEEEIHLLDKQKKKWCWKWDSSKSWDSSFGKKTNGVGSETVQNNNIICKKQILRGAGAHVWAHTCTHTQSYAQPLHACVKTSWPTHSHTRKRTYTLFPYLQHSAHEGQINLALDFRAGRFFLIPLSRCTQGPITFLQRKNSQGFPKYSDEEDHESSGPEVKVSMVRSIWPSCAKCCRNSHSTVKKKTNLPAFKEWH